MNRIIPVLLLFAGVLLHSCKKDVVTYYTTGINLENYDNSGSFAHPASNIVDRDCYVLRINYESDQTAFNGVDDEHSYEPGNKPTQILIWALQPFDSTHPANTSLNDYFIAGPGMTSHAYSVVTDFVNTGDYYPTHDPDDLWLMVPPDNIGPFRFVVQMDFDNGVIVRDTTANVNLVQ